MVFLLLVVVRWIHFTSVFVLFGSAFFWFYMPRSRSSAGTGQLTQTLDATVVLLRIAAPVAAISGVAWLACILINITSDFHSVVDPEDLRLYFFEPPFGTVSFARLALLAAAVLITALPWRGYWWLAALSGIGALLLISQAWLGHAAEGGAGLYGDVMVTVYAIHMLAAGAWVGGLPPLLFALAEQRRFGPWEARDCTLYICARFSLMAMVAVTLIVLSGIANAGFRVMGSFGKLFDTSYGDPLLTKVAVVAVMLALAYFNRFVAMPRLRAASLKGMAQIVKLGHSVTLEVALSVLVLGAAAVLGITPPPQ